MFTFEGHEIDYDIDTITVDELREIKRKLKLTGRGFFEGLEQIDPDAFTALYWVTMRHSGQPELVLSDDLDFPLLKFAEAWAQAQAIEAAKAQAEADPTRVVSLPDTKTQARRGSSTTTSVSSGMNTSPRSPRSTGSGPGTPDG